MAVNSNPSNLSRGFARRKELSPGVMEKQGEQGRLGRALVPGGSLLQSSIPWLSAGQGLCRSISSFVSSMAEPPRPFPGTPQLTQLCSLGFSPPIRMLCPSSRTLCTVLGVTESLWTWSSAARCGFPSRKTTQSVGCSSKDPPV